MSIPKRRRQAFTLIEVLIVVVIMAVLAATIIPQFSSSTKDARESALRFNLHALRSQIELYKLHHSGAVPTISGGVLPQLTSATDASGAVGAPGPSFPYGPYMLNGLPTNPITGSSTVTATASFPPTAASGNGGWLYHEATGQIAADTAECLTW
ncbi:MAG: type II secretion system protein [Pirellulales bacterium]|jgi:prepilin-type N-terminal cleavage/methylation domain-containing protein